MKTFYKKSCLLLSIVFASWASIAQARMGAVGPSAQQGDITNGKVEVTIDQQVINELSQHGGNIPSIFTNTSSGSTTFEIPQGQQLPLNIMRVDAIDNKLQTYNINVGGVICGFTYGLNSDFTLIPFQATSAQVSGTIDTGFSMANVKAVCTVLDSGQNEPHEPSILMEIHAQ